MFIEYPKGARGQLQQGSPVTTNQTELEHGEALQYGGAAVKRQGRDGRGEVGRLQRGSTLAPQTQDHMPLWTDRSVHAGLV